MIRHYIRKLSAAFALLAPVSLMALEKEGETWLISSADELIEFAQMVNSGEAYSIYGNADARLTTDIDLRGRETDFPMIGTAERAYQGNFNGQLHSITFNLETASDNSGLFAYLNGTVQNLIVNGSMTVNHNSCGAIAGTAVGFAMIENCTSNVDIRINEGRDIGGFVGFSVGIHTPPYIRIENCIYTGHIMGHTANSAGIVGFCYSGDGGGNQTIIKNCLVTGEFDIEIENDYNHIIACGEVPHASVRNCYYVHPAGIGVKEGQEITQVTMEQVQNGEACYLLNVSEYKWGGTLRSTVFRQNIGEDKIPVFDQLHGVVDKIGPEGYATWAGGNFNNDIGAYNAVRVAEGVSAYAGTIKGHSLQLHPVEVMNGYNGNGYVIKGEPGYYSFMPTSEEPTDVENDLGGGNDVLDVRWAIYYVLAVKDDVLGFYKVDQSGNAINSHTAYLVNPNFDADVKMITLIFDDETTGIETAHGAEPIAHSKVYDLSGRSIEKLQNGRSTLGKGVYIVNGKKVLK